MNYSVHADRPHQTLSKDTFNVVIDVDITIITGCYDPAVILQVRTVRARLADRPQVAEKRQQLCGG